MAVSPLPLPLPPFSFTLSSFHLLLVFTVLVSFCNIYRLAIYFSFSLLQSRRAAELPICLPFCDSSCRPPLGVGEAEGGTVANDSKQRLCQLCHLSSCCPNWSSLKTHQSMKSMRRILIDGAATRGVGKGSGGGGTWLQASVVSVLPVLAVPVLKLVA